MDNRTRADDSDSEEGDKMTDRMQTGSYRAIVAANWSSLKVGAESWARYKWALAHPREDSDAMRVGRAAHCSVFEPDRFPLSFVVWDGGARRGGDWTAFKAANAARTILTEDQYADAIGMRDSLRANPLTARYLADGIPEAPIRWIDRETGIACKGRVDWISRSGCAVVDLKTTRSISAGMFASQAASLAYHGQLAFYRWGVRAMMGLDYQAVILAVESAAPYECAVFRVEEESLWEGEEMARRLLNQLAICQRDNVWPGRYVEEQVLYLPKWAKSDDTDEGFEVVEG